MKDDSLNTAPETENTTDRAQTEAPRDTDATEQPTKERAGSHFGIGEAAGAVFKLLTNKKLLTESSTLFGELGKIAIGRSDVQIPEKDWRFKDPTWHNNPLFKRISQSYLATSKAINNLVPDDLHWEDRERAKFAASILTTTLAPNNWLAANPAALKEAVDTRGASLIEGSKNLVGDMIKNGGMPTQVDTSKLKAGVEMAITPGAVVFRHEMFELIQYKPTTDKICEVPTLLIPPQIGKYYFADLSPGRSFIEHSVANGIPFFTVSWRNPSKKHGHWRLEDYVQALVEATDAINSISKQNKINYVGFCAGGITLSVLTSHLESIGRDCVNTATFCVTLLDFKTETAIGGFRLPALLRVASKSSKKKGYLSGKELGKLFAWMRPNDLIWNYWFNNYLMGKQPPSFDILAWNADTSNMAAGLHHDFLDLFEDCDRLSNGDIEILGHPLDISKTHCDKFVLGALTDHLTPWTGCYNTTQLMGGTSTFALSSSGHIAALVNPPSNKRARFWMAENTVTDPEEWKAGAEEMQGSWWNAWADWNKQRSGKEQAAPKKLGNKAYPAVCDAPGEYIFEIPKV